jgi:hypothetical protein
VIARPVIFQSPTVAVHIQNTPIQYIHPIDQMFIAFLLLTKSPRLLVNPGVFTQVGVIRKDAM